MRPPALALGRLMGLVFLGAVLPCWSAPTPPVAEVRPVTDTYFGVPVVDNYRYMENLKDPEVQAWMKAQAAYTRTTLDRIPGRSALATRIMGLMGKDLSRGYFMRRGERLFYFLLDPGANLPKLAYREGLGGTEHILVDPEKMGKDAAHHVALDWYSPSWDGRYVAYGLSEGGSEESVLHVLDIATGQIQKESIDRTSDCVVAWRPDNRSFFYLRYPKPGPDTPLSQTAYNAVAFAHELGKNTDGDGDEAVFGHGVSPDTDVPEGQGAYIQLFPGSPYALAVANHNMDSNPNTFFVVPLDQIKGAKTPWQKVAVPDDGLTEVRLHGDRMYFLTQKNATRFQIRSTPLAHPDVNHADAVVPEGPNVLTEFAIASDAIYVAERAGASFEAQRISFDGNDRQAIKAPFAGTIAGLVADVGTPGILFNLQGWVNAPREMVYDPSKDRVLDSGLIPPAPSEPAGIEAHDEFATSYDGTRIPVSILAQKGVARDGSHPTIVFGYGSYGLSMDPFYDPAWQAWLEQGGIVAVSHMRGGGEYGDDWHRAGQKRWKINTIMDFIASAQLMIDEQYTQSKFLAANSASAGGIVMGGALTVDPALFRVVLDDVGLSDMLRFETEPNGPPNVPEDGSVATEDGFHGLYSMSAYAHIHDRTPYPAVMFTTGANDPRVSSWHMLKMAARVQAATTSGRPVLLRIDFDAGHGIGSSQAQRANELADEWSFALWQMGKRGYQPAAPKASPPK